MVMFTGVVGLEFNKRDSLERVIENNQIEVCRIAFTIFIIIRFFLLRKAIFITLVGVSTE